MTLTLVRRIEDSSGVSLEFANEDGSVSVTYRNSKPEADTTEYRRGDRYEVTIVP